MSSLDFVPKSHIDNLSQIADFIELECLRRTDRNVSLLDIDRIIRRGADNADEGDSRIGDTPQAIVEAFDEISDRQRACGANSYPYGFLGTQGDLVEIRPFPRRGKIDKRLIYIFLLLATRMNMKYERIQADDDATKIFENLCMEVAERFWGGPAENVDSMLFGTGSLTSPGTLERRSFRGQINELCKRMGEGISFEEAPNTRSKKQDDCLDIVVWRKFADSRSGQLIGFGQCKTGKSWNEHLGRLDPQKFCQKWMRKGPAVDPLQLFFLAERVPSRTWYNHCVNAGILFDRCRIVEYADKVSAGTAARMKSWTLAALNSQGLKLP